MSNVTNTTNSCWNLTATIPQAWVTSQVSDPFFNTSGCAVPVCGSNPAILASCSNTTLENLSPFNGSRGDAYFSYILPKNTNAATYQAYQDCLLHNNAVRFKCANPLDSSNTCPGQYSITTPSLALPHDGFKYQLCTIPNNINSSRVMSSCCDNLHSDLGGCQISCWNKYVNGNTLAQCLTSAYQREGTNLGYLCTPSDTQLRNVGNSIRYFDSGNPLRMLVSALFLMVALL